MADRAEALGNAGSGRDHDVVGEVVTLLLAAAEVHEAEGRPLLGWRLRDRASVLEAAV